MNYTGGVRGAYYTVFRIFAWTLVTMATFINVSSTEVGKMNVSSKIEELRLKINLSESKKKTDYQESEEEKLKNANYIASLKENIETLKLTEASKSINVCPLKVNAYKVKETRELLKWFDQCLFDIEKQTNLLTYMDRSNREAITKLENVKSNLFTHFLATNNEQANFKKIQELENNLEKMQMKNSEAEFIEKKYGAVVTVLLEEIIQLQKESLSFKFGVLTTKVELNRLKATAHKAVKAFRTVQVQLLQENDHFQKQRSAWEKSLKIFHQQVDSIFIESYLRRSEDKLATANETFISCEESSSPATEGLSTRFSKDVLEKMKMSTGSGEMMLELNDPSNSMEGAIAELQEKVTRLQYEQEKLQDELRSCVNPIQLIPIISSKHQQLDERFKEQQERLAKALKYEEIYTRFMETLKASLRQLNLTIALGCKMNSIGSPSPDDTLELLAVCMEKVEFLVEQSQNYDRENALQIYEGVKFSENVEEAQLMLKPKSKTIKRPEGTIKSQIKFEEYEIPDHEILTRATLKRQAKSILDHYAKMHSKGTRTQTNVIKIM